MPGSSIIKGQARTALVAQTNLSATGSIGLGAFGVGNFSRFAGMISLIGSATVCYRMGPSSGTYWVSSSFVANSGASTIDYLNYGHACDWGVTAINSQVVTGILIYGESVR